MQTVTNLSSTNWVAVNNGVPYTAIVVTNTGRDAYFRIFIKPVSPVGTTQIPGGSFVMGDALDGGADAIPVTATVSSYYMDLDLVTYSQWQSVYAYATAHGYGFANAGSGKDTNHPVNNIDWYDAVKWSNARSQQAGLTPAYYTDAGLTRIYTNGESEPYVNWTVNGFRLPTEAEWEMGARGGLAGQRFPFGDTISQSQANYFGYPGFLSYDNGPTGNNPGIAYGEYPYTSPVGYFATNSFGLFDMCGNVSEWCWDWYFPLYSGGTNPRGPAIELSGTPRVRRGGDWNDGAALARCAARSSDIPTTTAGTIGFRCVRAH